MSRVTKKTNYRIEIEIHKPYWAGDTDTDDYKSMLEQIKRHVDGAEHAAIVYDTESICSNCRAEWAEDGDLYNGGCCDADEAFYVKRNEVKR